MSFGCSDDDGQQNNNNNNNNQITTETICDDNIDNDEDGQTDCDDPDCVNDAACYEFESMTFVHTSDIHSHAAGYGPFLDYTPLNTADNDTVEGGYARLATVIGTIKAQKAAQNIPVVTTDGGDFLMGSVFDMAVDDPITLKFFTLMGYDAITLGNHEFDWTADGLALHLSNALDATPMFNVPIVASNMTTSATDDADNAIEALVTAGAIRDKLVLTLPNGLVVGILGGMGDEGYDDSKSTIEPITFDQVDTTAHDPGLWQARVDDLRNNDNADIVMVVFHGGINSMNQGDSVDLATEVNGIDILASGHKHTASTAPFEVNDTLIFEPGWAGQYVAQLDVVYNTTLDEISSWEFTLHDIDDTVTGDPTMNAMVDMYLAGIDQTLLNSPLAVGTASPVAETEIDLIGPEEIPFTETNLGNLCADAVRTIGTISVLATSDPTPISVAMVAAGVIRDPIWEGNTGLVTLADVYGALPLGMTPATDQLMDIPGWPLISIYLTPLELYEAAKVTTTLSLMMGKGSAYMHLSGMKVDYTAATGAVDAVYLCGNAIPTETGHPLADGDYFSETCSTTALDDTDNTTLIRVAADLYAALAMYKAAAVGLEIHPKDRFGVEIDLSDIPAVLAYRLDADPLTAGTQEIKEWQALLMFLTGMPIPGVGHVTFFADTNTNMLLEVTEALYGTGTPLGTAMGRYNAL